MRKGILLRKEDPLFCVRARHFQTETAAARQSQPQLNGPPQAYLAVQRFVNGVDERLAVAVERAAERQVVRGVV